MIKPNQVMLMLGAQTNGEEQIKDDIKTKILSCRKEIVGQMVCQ